MYCPKCDTTYTITKTIINFQNLPVEEVIKDVKYCPICGQKIGQIETKKLK